MLAIDTGTTSAACADSASGRPVFFTWYGARWSEAGEFGARLHHFAIWLDDLITMTSPALLAFEAPLTLHGSSTITNADTIRLLYALAGEVERVAFSRSIDCVEVHVQAAKRAFAGSARADKKAVMFRCRQLGWNIKNEHEADAAGVWFTAKASTDKSWQVPILSGRSANV